MPTTAAIWDGLILGLVQGLTEFLPISSSGHLVLMQAALGFEPAPGSGASAAALFSVALHLATLGAVVLYFRRDLLALARALPALAGPRRMGVAWADEGAGRLLLLLAIGSVPTALIGLGFKDHFESLFSAPRAAAVALLVNGGILLATRWLKSGERETPQTGMRRAIAIGIAQGLAITPGISRSGLTISTGMLCGLRPGFALRFSFLLSIPAILGATLLEARHIETVSLHPMPLIVGAAAAFAAGLGSLWMLERVVAKGHFAAFAPYCWIVGLLALYFIG